MATANGSSAPGPAVQLDAVSFQYDSGRGVNQINLALEHGRTTALLGPNGAGKSTLLKLISGELIPQSGSVRLFDDVHSHRLRRRIGQVFQEPSSDDLMTVGETLQLHAQLFDLPRGQRTARIDDLLQATDLHDRADDLCGVLSGGLRRRLDLARALLHDPDLLLLDEPTLALDPDSTHALWNLIDGLRSRGVAVVLSTNNTAEAEAYADRVVIIDAGSIVADAPPSTLTAELRPDAVQLDAPDLLIAATLADDLETWPDVGRIRRSDASLHLTVDSAPAFLPPLFQRHADRIANVRTRRSSLQDAWFQIVGAPIDDDASDSLSQAE